MFPARVYVGQIIAVFAIVLIAIWGATQWAAAALGHQAALGPAWFNVTGFPVYPPWRLFEWWYVYDAYAPHVFEQAGDGWIERRLRSFVAKKWRNTVWRRYPLPRLVQEFGLVRLIYLVPGINPSSTPQWRPHRKAACGKTARAV